MSARRESLARRAISAMSFRCEGAEPARSQCRRKLRQESRPSLVGAKRRLHPSPRLRTSRPEQRWPAPGYALGPKPLVFEIPRWSATLCKCSLTLSADHPTMTDFQPLLLLTLGAIVSVACAAAPAQDRAARDAGAQDAVQGERLAAARQLGLDMAIAIYPVHLLGGANRDVGDALGLVLEKRGLPNLTPSETVFASADSSDWTATVGAFGTHVRTHPQAPYALFAAIAGTPKTGPEAVRYALVDARGEVVLQAESTRADATFVRAMGPRAEPMTCCLYVRDRLAEALRWPSARPTAAPGRFARLWNDKSGGPGDDEREAMKRRHEDMRTRGAGIAVLVLPTRVGRGLDRASAGRLAEAIHGYIGAKATASESGPAIELAATSNEQKRLWDFARALRAHLRQHPAEADYVLMADYAIDTDKGERGCIHLVLCDRNGDWVATDFQNSHHRDYLSVSPKSATESDAVAAVRLKQILR
ncbi:MAG: hypothetical protein R3F56_13565 [Planctomycetota bacterium]